LLISWNVAGWTSTHGLIRRHYTDLGAYLERLGKPAFFCLQETKVQAKDLRNQNAAQQLGAVLKGYRSYWAFQEDKDPKYSSFNGVATWVREDVPVLGATQRALGVSEFDQQGRALLTDHGSCVVVNVYAPCSAGSGDAAAAQAASATKLQFLEALGRTLEGVRSQGKRAIVCGDLNLTHRALDQKPGRRLLWVDSEGHIDMGPSQTALGPFAEWKEQWQPVKEVSASSGVPAEKLASAAECIHIREGRCVPWLRSLVSPEGQAPWADIFAEVHPDAQDRFTSWGIQHHNLRYANHGSRLDYVISDRATFDECVVKSSSSSLPGGVAAQGEESEGEAVEATSSRAAANAATHFDGWHAAAVSGVAQGDGLGLQTDNMRLNDTQFPSKPFTGLIYTPPSYSDHIAVSVLFKGELVKAPGGNSEIAAKCFVAEPSHTKQSQPWLAQPSIASFFGATPRRTEKAKAESPSAASPPTPAEKEKPAPAPAPAAPKQKEAVAKGGASAKGRPAKRQRR